jgi:hypothetical protein
MQEIVVTLYAMWNTRIIKHEPITDDLFKPDLYKDRLDEKLQWMRNNQIIPDGWGKIVEKAS